MRTAVNLLQAINKSLPRKREFSLNEKQLEQIKSVSGVIIGILGAVGIAAVSIMAPNALLVLKQLQKPKKGFAVWNSKKAPQALYQTFYYLKRSGGINITKRNREFWLELTEKGKQQWQKLSKGLISIPKPKSWDGKWWLVAADIPTKNYRQSADLLRKNLKQLNFFSLQRTLWVYPYNPVQELDILLKRLRIQNFVTLMEVSRLDKDDENKIKFYFKELRLI